MNKHDNLNTRTKSVKRNDKMIHLQPVLKIHKSVCVPERLWQNVPNFSSGNRESFISKPGSGPFSCFNLVMKMWLHKQNCNPVTSTIF